MPASNWLSKISLRSLIKLNLFFLAVLNLNIGNLKISPELFSKINLTLIDEAIEANGRLNGGATYKINAGEIDEESIEFGGNINFEISSLINISAYYNEVMGAEYSSQEFGIKANFLW